MIMPMSDQFSYGAINPIISFLMALVGAIFGLICTARARRPGTQHRVRWLLFAGVAIGGVGIWLMHFMAMLGFDVPSGSIRYNVLLTVASLVTSIVIVTAGLLFVGLGRPSALKIVVGGIVTGLGVAGMHYTGMAAVNIDGKISYEPRLVAASILIAVVASTVALWFTVTATSPSAIGAASVIFALAVCLMHYTGMASVRVTESQTAPQPSGVSPISLVIPIVVIAMLTLFGMMVASMNMMASDDPVAAGSAGSLHMPMSVPWDDLTGGQPPQRERDPDFDRAREEHRAEGRHSDRGEWGYRQ